MPVKAFVGKETLKKILTNISSALQLIQFYINKT